jgi:hypothetical protein
MSDTKNQLKVITKSIGKSALNKIGSNIGEAIFNVFDKQEPQMLSELKKANVKLDKLIQISDSILKDNTESNFQKKLKKLSKPISRVNSAVIQLDNDRNPENDYHLTDSTLENYKVMVEKLECAGANSTESILTEINENSIFWGYADNNNDIFSDYSDYLFSYYNVFDKKINKGIPLITYYSKMNNLLQYILNGLILVRAFYDDIITRENRPPDTNVYDRIKWMRNKACNDFYKQNKPLVLIGHLLLDSNDFKRNQVQISLIKGEKRKSLAYNTELFIDTNVSFDEKKEGKKFKKPVHIDNEFKASKKEMTWNLKLNEDRFELLTSNSKNYYLGHNIHKVKYHWYRSWIHKPLLDINKKDYNHFTLELVGLAKKTGNNTKWQIIVLNDQKEEELSCMLVNQKNNSVLEAYYNPEPVYWSRTYSNCKNSTAPIFRNGKVVKQIDCKAKLKEIEPTMLWDIYLHYNFEEIEKYIENQILSEVIL